VLLGQMDIGPADLDMLAVQLSAALDGPPLLYLSADDLAEPAPRTAERITRAWQDLIRRACRP
jgi:polyketide synthase 12